MIATIVSALTSRVGAFISAGAALILLGAVVIQNGQINGWPIFGGGLKAQIATLDAQIAKDKTDLLTFQVAAQAAVKQRDDAVKAAQDKIAAAYQDGLNHSQPITQTIIQKVPTYVSQKSDAACVVPWGAVRLFDAAATGSDPGLVSAAIASGQPDDAASTFHLSDLVTLYAKNIGAGRDNADQLSSLQAAVTAAGK